MNTPKTVVIASKNPIKVEAVKRSFRDMFTDMSFEFISISAESNVSDQPMSSEETRLGALNRAKNAMNMHPADYAIGLEGGLCMEDNEAYVISYVALIDVHNHISIAHSGTIKLIPEVYKMMIENNMELGDAEDVFFKSSNTKQGLGYVGTMTGGIIKREDAFYNAVIRALVPYKHHTWFYK